MLTALSIYSGDYAGMNLDTDFIYDKHPFYINGYTNLLGPVYAAKAAVYNFLKDGSLAFFGTTNYFDNGAGDGVQKLADGLSNSFVVRCLNSGDDDLLSGQVVDECNPFLGLGPDPFLSKITNSQPESWAKSDNFACVTDRGLACKQILPENPDIGSTIEIYVVYYFFAEVDRSSEEPKEIPTGNWCIGMYVRIDWEFTGKNYAPRYLKGTCRSIDDNQVVLYQSAMRDEMVKAVDSVAPEIEDCFARECGLDTKVSDN